MIVDPFQVMISYLEFSNGSRHFFIFNFHVSSWGHQSYEFFNEEKLQLEILMAFVSLRFQGFVTFQNTYAKEVMQLR